VLWGWPPQSYGWHPAAAFGFARQPFGDGDEYRREVVGRPEGAAHQGGILDVFVGHLVSELAHRHPGISRLPPAEAFGAVAIVDGRPRPLAERDEERGEQFVAKGVLQAAEAPGGKRGRRKTGTDHVFRITDYHIC